MKPLARLWFAACFAAVTLVAAGADSGAARFRYATPLALPSSSQEELAEWVLTPEAYRATRSDLADLRVARAESGESVPCLVECVTQEREERVRQSVDLRIAKAEELGDKRFQVTLERVLSQEKPGPLCGLTVQTPLRDFERRVTVEVSADAEVWRRVVDAARIIDLSSHADFRKTEIALPSVTERYLRLTVDQMDDTQTGATAAVTTSTDADGAVRSMERQIREERRPFRIDRVAAWEERVRQVRDARPLAAREVRAAAVPADLRARFPQARVLGFEAGRAPLERIRLGTAKKIVSLDVLLFARVGDAEWRQIASARVTRIAFRDFLDERMEVCFEESRADAYCLVLPEGEAAADVALVGGKGPDYRVVFPCDRGQSCALLAGDPEAEGPAGYQPEQVRVLLRRGIRTVKATTAGWRENPDWRRTAPAYEFKWLLPAAIALAVAVLGLAVALALRRMPAEG